MERTVVFWSIVIVIATLAAYELRKINQQIVTIIVTATITVVLCYGFYLNFLKISYCKYCGKEMKGTIPYCSKEHYEKAQNR